MRWYILTNGQSRHSLSISNAHALSAWVLGMRGLTRDGTAEPVSRGQIPRRERRQGKIYFLTPSRVYNLFFCSLLSVQQTTSGIGNQYAECDKQPYSVKYKDASNGWHGKKASTDLL